MVTPQLMRGAVRQHVPHWTTGPGPDWVCSVVLLMAMGCAAPSVPEDAVAVPFWEVDGATRTRSGFNEKQQMVLRSSADLESFWTVLERGRQPTSTPPAIDFTTSTVIAAALGSRGSSGFSVGIEGVFLAGDEWFVVVRETRPGRGCVTGPAETNPVTAVGVQGVFTQATFVDEVVVRNCSGG